MITGKSETRLGVQIPTELHRRMKMVCASEGKTMQDVIVELLEQRFPTVPLKKGEKK